MDELPTFRRLLEGLAADGLVHDDLDHLLAVEHLLQVATNERWTRNQLAAGLASLYANTPESWARIDRALRHALGDRSALPPVRPPPEEPTTAPADVYLSLGVAKPQSRFKRSVRQAFERLLRRMARMSAVSWTALFAFGLVASTLVGSLAIEQGSELIEQTFTPEPPDTPSTPEQQPEAPNESTPETPIPDLPEPKDEVTFRSDGSQQLEIPKVAQDVATDRGDDQSSITQIASAITNFISHLGNLALLLLVFAVSFLGLTWLRTPGAFSEHVRERRREAKVLREKSAEALGSPTVRYLVERFEPFGAANAAAHIDDIATILGRIGCEVPGETLDVEQSLDNTVRAGGMPTPAMEPTHAPRELLIFVDIEEGDHPYRHAVEWVLNRWRRGGLQFVRYNFALRPDTGLELWDRNEEHADTRGQRADLDATARRCEGMPLLIFSRGRDLVIELQATSEPIAAKWLALVRAWPKRVYVDLDPRPIVQHLDTVLSDKRSTLETLQAHGFMCIPFTLKGLEAGASHLAGRSATVPEYKPLRPLAEVRPHIERWLATVAVVPDPTWVQMEAYRREFFADDLPDPRYVQRALEWVQEAFAKRGEMSDGTKDNGQRLALDGFANDLLVAQLRRDHGQEALEQLVTQARKMLLKQLRGAAPTKDDPSYMMWSLKVAYQEAMLAPARADELLAPFLGTEVEEEVLDMVAGAEAREAQLRDSGELRQPLAARVRSWGRDANRVPVGWLGPWAEGRGSPKVWVVGAVGAMFVVTSTVAAFVQSKQPEVAGLNGVHISGGLGYMPADLEVVLSQEDAPTKVPDASPGVRAEVWEGDCDFSKPPVFPPKPNPDVRASQTGRSCGVVETALKDTDAPMNLIGLSGGEFTMGSPAGEGGEDEHPQHRVALSRFAICETEVSVRQYELVTEQKPSNCDYGCKPEHPVQNVSWKDSAKFLNALTRYENRRHPSEDKLTECYDETTWVWNQACTGYRLPTEAEWEYAARAGTTTRYFFGDDDGEICSYANVRSDCNDGFEELAPVKTGRLKPNPWGLHAMAGNVWEWAYDWYDGKIYANTTYQNPAFKNTASLRVLRGGSFVVWPSGARSAGRDWSGPVDRDWFSGFRCARGPSPQH